MQGYIKNRLDRSKTIQQKPLDQIKKNIDFLLDEEEEKDPLELHLENREKRAETLPITNVQNA